MAETDKKPAKPKSSHPTFFEMAKEALTTLGEKSGSSVPRLQSYIVEKYSLDPDSVRQHLKPALAKGLENGSFIRPKNSDAKGYTGRFKINKAKEAEEEKKMKEKAKALKDKEKAKEKKTTTTKKTTKTTPKKSVKSTTKKSAKSPKSKTKPKAPKPKVKTAASNSEKASKAKLKTPKKVAKTKAPKTPKSAKK